MAIIIVNIITSEAATIDCAMARPARPYAPGLDRLKAKIIFRPIVNIETNKGVLVSLCE